MNLPAHVVDASGECAPVLLARALLFVLLAPLSGIALASAVRPPIASLVVGPPALAADTALNVIAHRLLHAAGVGVRPFREFLRAQLGDAYAPYCARVPRRLPRLRPDGG